MLTKFLLELALVGVEWILWLLVVLSVISIGIMVERLIFYKRMSIDLLQFRGRLATHLESGDSSKTLQFLKPFKGMEGRVLQNGISITKHGVPSVEETLTGTLAVEKVRYEQNLGFLGTVGANAPFIGLFGTVLGIIQAFNEFSIGNAEVAQGVMDAIAEALIATAVGLLVAIPAVVAYNFFKGYVKKVTSNTELLARTLLAHLKSTQE